MTGASGQEVSGSGEFQAPWAEPLSLVFLVTQDPSKPEASCARTSPAIGWGITGYGEPGIDKVL